MDEVESPPVPQPALHATLRTIKITACIVAVMVTISTYYSWQGFKMARETRIVEDRFRKHSEAFYAVQEAFNKNDIEALAAAQLRMEKAKEDYEWVVKLYRSRWLE